MNSIISAVASDFIDTIQDTPERPPYSAPIGKVWVKNPDEYDSTNDIIWEGQWILQESYPSYVYTTPRKRKLDFDTDFDCKRKKLDENRYWKNLAEKHRKTVSSMFCPEYHVCTHKEKGHSVCSKSVCCDLFFHEGKCNWISPSGKVGGDAQMYGEW
jgi:hypothetical protein